MGFVMGSSCFLHSPIHLSSFPPSSSSSSSSQSVFLYSCIRNTEISKTKNRAPMVDEGSKNGGFCKRRAVLFVGISVLPLLQLRAPAIEGLVTDEREQVLQSDEPPNPFLSLLNGLGVYSSGLLGALYVLAQQEKKEIEASIESVGEEKKALGEKLKEKLALIEVLLERINLLSIEMEEKEDNVRNLGSSLAEKESEVNSLNAICIRTKNDLAKANSEIKGLKENLLKNQEELESKNAEFDDLNARASALVVERDESNLRVDAIQKEFDDLKGSSEEKEALGYKILGEKDYELHRLKEKLELALNEASANQNVIVDLTQERDDLEKMLDLELNNMKNLKNGLRITRETLETSRDEASDLARQLKKSRNLCTELETELFRAGAEFSEARHLLQRSFFKAKKGSEELASELRTAKELLKKTKDELQIVSLKLAAAAENSDILQKELVDVYKKVESAANDLKEEKKIVASLNKELKDLETQILKYKEARKSLETELEEATKSLDEMNRHALLLARELEIANSRISGLEEEKDLLYNSLVELKNVSQEAQENIEDAHNLAMRLGKEQESMEKKGKKLEDELASAKGVAQDKIQ